MSTILQIVIPISTMLVLILIMIALEEWKHRQSPNYRHKDTAPMRSYDIDVNAIAILRKIPWLEAYDDLAATGKKNRLLMNAEWNVASYLHENGYPLLTLTASGRFGTKLILGRKFVKKFNKGRYLMITSGNAGNHATAVVNGRMYGLKDYGDEFVAVIIHADDMTELFKAKSRYFSEIAVDTDNKCPFKKEEENDNNN